MTKTAAITRIERLPSSVNGNPRYRIGFDDATSAITSSDYSFVYEIGNPGYREGDRVHVTLTAAGRISDLSRAAGLDGTICEDCADVAAGHAWTCPTHG